MWHRRLVHCLVLFQLLYWSRYYYCHAYYYHHHQPAMLAVHGPWDGVQRQQLLQGPRRSTTALLHHRHHNVIPHNNNNNHREGFWRFRNRNRIFFRTDSSSTGTMMLRMSATTFAPMDTTTLQPIASMDDDDDDCHCCGGENDDYDGRPNDGTTCHKNNNNEWVIRHVHQSTIDPAIWQQYMVPPVSSSSWGHAPFAKNTHRPTTVDISLLWNSTTTTTTTATTTHMQNDAMTATAERFWELYEAKRALVEQQHSGQHRPPPWFEKLWDSVANNNSPEPIATSPNPYRHAMIQNLASAMTEFRNFCEEHLWTTPHHDRRSTFEMRLLCTYGSDAAKCPIWHVDHVPCRYVQTLYGPTVLFFPDQHDNQRVYHRIISTAQQQHDDDDEPPSQPPQDNYEFVSVPERNAFLLSDIDDMSRSVGRANVGEGMILLGQSSSSRSPPWNTTGKAAAVHKSPWIASPDQGRILLTINVHDASTTL